MSLFRSEPMGLYMLNIEKDFASDVMETVARCNCLHFIDSNKGKETNRTYKDLIHRCDKANARIKYIASLIVEKYGPLIPPPSVEIFLKNLDNELTEKGMDSMAYFEHAEEELELAENLLIQQRKKSEKVQETCDSILEKKYVVTRASDLILDHVTYF